MSGTFVAVVGPSGAGKDTLIAGARLSFQGDERYAFPRRVVTRPPSGFEDHEVLTPAAFETTEAGGGFALSWLAHGLSYGIPNLVLRDLAENRVVVCNLSRRAIAEAEQRFDTVRVVLVTAPRGIIRERLLARGREDRTGLEGRLAREAALDVDVAADLVVDNGGDAKTSIEKMVTYLQDLGELTWRRRG